MWGGEKKLQKASCNDEKIGGKQQTNNKTLIKILGPKNFLHVMNLFSVIISSRSLWELDHIIDCSR